MENICSCKMLRKSMPNNEKSMANEKGKKSYRDLIQNSDLPKIAHFCLDRNGNLLTKISFAYNL